MSIFRQGTLVSQVTLPRERNDFWVPWSLEKLYGPQVGFVMDWSSSTVQTAVSQTGSSVVAESFIGGVALPPAREVRRLDSREASREARLEWLRKEGLGSCSDFAWKDLQSTKGPLVEPRVSFDVSGRRLQSLAKLLF